MKHWEKIVILMSIIGCMLLPISAKAQNAENVPPVLSIRGSGARTTQSVSKSYSIYSGNTVIAKITITASFRHDGTTVQTVSMKVSNAVTYGGWKFTQTSLTSSGGTVVLTGTMTKALNPSIPVTVTMSCDKNGNVS